MMRRIGSILCGVTIAAGCGPAVDVNDGSADPGSTSDGAPTTATTGATATTAGGPTTMTTSNTTLTSTTVASTSGTTSNDESSSDGPITSAFITDPDGGGRTHECSTWEQDCDRGEKCMPWANDGGNSWNATRCSPIVDDPDQVDEPCTVEGSGVSGIDSCDIRAMCWDVDETKTGTCVPMCIGDENNPTCEDASRACQIGGDGTLALCFPRCDPFQQDCHDGSACYVADGTTVCAPDASGEQGAYGDPCEFVNACDPGLSCESAAGIPGCDGGQCCTPFCNVNEANECPGVGQECIPLFEPAEAPPYLQHVGLCGLP